MKTTAFLFLSVLVNLGTAHAGPSISGGVFGGEIVHCEEKRGLSYSSFNLSKTSQKKVYQARYIDHANVKIGDFAMLTCLKGSQDPVLFECSEQRPGEGKFLARIFKTASGVEVEVSRSGFNGLETPIDQMACEIKK